LIDVTDPAAVRAEAERRRELLARGAKSFDASLDPIAAAGARVVDAAELGKLEKEIEHACDKLVLAIGGKVVKFSHPGKTKQTPGIADRLYGFPWLRLAVWWECKAPAGKQRPDQKLFQEDVTSCGQEYALGGLGDLKQWLVARGVVAGFHADGTPIPHPRS
jgi:hypothetical protein